jgi:hypothetical protein
VVDEVSTATATSRTSGETMDPRAVLRRGPVVQATQPALLQLVEEPRRVRLGHVEEGDIGGLVLRQPREGREHCSVGA